MIKRQLEKIKKALREQERDLSIEEQALKDLFGGGKKIWALEDSKCLPFLNRTLFPGNMETGSLFGIR